MVFVLVQRVGISVKEIIQPPSWHKGLRTPCCGPQLNAVVTFSLSKYSGQEFDSSHKLHRQLYSRATNLDCSGQGQSCEYYI